MNEFLNRRVAARAADRQNKQELEFARRKLTREDREEQRVEDEALRRLRAQLWAARRASARTATLTALRGLMIAGPIMAPMIVAWTGQAGFAMRALQWSFAAGILYAAAYELAGVFCAWMYHEARKDGDKGWEYRAATWVFALGSATQQWWHYSANWHATSRSVTFASMTMTGLMMWELFARLMHRRALRAKGLIGGVRPRFGLIRWIRFPRTAWVAWSLSIRDPGLATADRAWSAAERQRSMRSVQVRTRKGWLRRTPDLQPEIREVRPDPVRIEPDLAPMIEPTRPDPCPMELPVIGPWPRPAVVDIDSADDDAEFVPTDLEMEAVRTLVKRGMSINRANTAQAVRDLEGLIATKRAAQLAAWGRAQGGLQAI